MALTYLLTVVGVLAVPSVVLSVVLRERLAWRAYLTAVAVITGLGSAWSATLSAKGWWSFSLDYRTGLTLGDHLLLEEFLFYPFGGAMSLLLYVIGSARPARPAPRLYLATVLGGTLLACLAVAARGAPVPWYLVSMIVLYNGIVTLPPATWVAPRVHPIGWALSVAGMSSVGFLWDVLSVRHAWWTYDAGTGWLIAGAPLDDLDFFLFAPTAAITVYLAAQAAWSTTTARTPLHSKESA